MKLREFLPRGYVFTVVGIAVGVAGLVSLGATDVDLLGEVLGEGLRVSLWGGAAGVLLAWCIGSAVDARALRDGQQLFLFSPRLLVSALVFSVALGALAGGYATLHIVRLSPAEAIRRGS